MVSTFVTIWLLHVAAMLTPGANVLLVTQLAASGQRRSASYAALGVASGAAIWSTAAVLGVTALFAGFPRLVCLFSWPAPCTSSTLPLASGGRAGR